MGTLRTFLFIASVVLLAACAAAGGHSCPVTRPPDPPFTPPPSYPENYPYQRKVWYGTAKLWTAIPENGEWDCLYTCSNGDKMFWWREGYVYSEEPRPDLQVTGKRLDGSGTRVEIASGATNAFHPDFGSAMLVGGQVPAPGCWEITGRYKDAELSFVVWVGD